MGPQRYGILVSCSSHWGDHSSRFIYVSSRRSVPIVSFVASYHYNIIALRYVGIVNLEPGRVIPMEVCILQDTWNLSFVYWIPFLVYETFLFALALIKGIRSYHDKELTFKGHGAIRALHVLIRDSVLYFML